MSPKISVVVPTYRRPQALGQLLESLAGSSYDPSRFEVVVVDDGGEEDLDPVIGGVGDRLDVHLLGRSHAGPAAARQFGIDAARGRYLAFTDDDCRVAPDWLERLDAALEREPGCAIGGRTLNGLPANAYASASELILTYLYRELNHLRPRYFATNNVAFPAQAFRSVGGLDVEWELSGGEDRDLCRRWIAHGHGLVYEPEAVIWHAHPLTFATFWRQHYNYGRGARRLRRTATAGNDAGFQPLAFYTGLLRFSLDHAAAPNPPGRLLRLVILAEAATLAGYLRESSSERR